jgi:hypothetical protein
LDSGVTLRRSNDIAPGLRRAKTAHFNRC